VEDKVKQNQPNGRQDHRDSQKEAYSEGSTARYVSHEAAVLHRIALA
jgi:hypothetical protein